MTRTLYLDMDGVVADFDRYAASTLGKNNNGKELWSQADWDILKTNPRLYRDLPKTPEADELYKFCMDFTIIHKWDIFFLTAIPHDNDMPWAFYDKVIWANKHFPGIPVLFGPYSRDKYIRCKTGDVLIDDRTSNCVEWSAAGGVSIYHRGDVQKTITSLMAL